MDEHQKIIIGGGLAGVTSFYELVTRGIPCTLIEAHSEVGQGTSFANGAVLHPSHPDPWNSPGIGKYLLASLFNPTAPIRVHWSELLSLIGWGTGFIHYSSASFHRAITAANFRLAEYSTRATQALAASVDLKFDLATPGTIKLVYNENQRLEALHLAQRLSKFGLNYSELTQDELFTREPALAHMRTRPLGGLYFPDDLIGDAHLFCMELRRLAEAAGGKVICETQVRRLVTDRGKVIGVELDGPTSDTILHGDVILCAGTASPALARPFGVKLPIRPAKGYSVTFDAPLEGGPRHPVLDPQTHVAVTPLKDKLRVLGMAEFAGIDRQIDMTRVEILQQIFTDTFPQIAAAVDWHKAQNWTGLRPMSNDGRPFIGASGVEGLWVNSGHGHLGWTMAMGSARLLVDQMLGKTPEIDPTPYALTSKRQKLF